MASNGCYFGTILCFLNPKILDQTTTINFGFAIPPHKLELLPISCEIKLSGKAGNEPMTSRLFGSQAFLWMPTKTKLMKLQPGF